MNKFEANSISSESNINSPYSDFQNNVDDSNFESRIGQVGKYPDHYGV